MRASIRASFGICDILNKCEIEKEIKKEYDKKAGKETNRDYDNMYDKWWDEHGKDSFEKYAKQNKDDE